MNDKHDFATSVGERLRAAEQSIDHALGDIALIIHESRHAAGAGFAAQAGRPALRRVREAMNAAMDAREGIVAAHDLLARTAKSLGVTYTMGGPGEGKDQPPIGDGGGITASTVHAA